MKNIGVVPGAQIISSKKVGGSGKKPDIVVTFAEGNSLRISAKMSNADFFENWPKKAKIEKLFGKEILERIKSSSLEFAKSYKPNPAYGPYVGISIAFGKRKGQTQISFAKCVGGIKQAMYLIAGGDINNENNANCLLKQTSVPHNINDLIKSLLPINNKTIGDLIKDFSVIFRPVYIWGNNSNLSKDTYCRVFANKKLSEPTLIKSQDELMKVCRWEKTNEHCNHRAIILDLEKSNIIFKLKQGVKLYKKKYEFLNT